MQYSTPSPLQPAAASAASSPRVPQLIVARDQVNAAKRKKLRRAQRRAERTKLRAMDAAARRTSVSRHPHVDTGCSDAQFPPRRYIVAKIIEQTQKGLAKALGARGRQVRALPDAVSPPLSTCPGRRGLPASAPASDRIVQDRFRALWQACSFITC